MQVFEQTEWCLALRFDSGIIKIFQQSGKYNSKQISLLNLLPTAEE